MDRIPRKACTYEFKLVAVRLVESGQRLVEAARSLGVIEQTLSNNIKAHGADCNANLAALFWGAIAFILRYYQGKI
jgi:transposase-like protein